MSAPARSPSPLVSRRSLLGFTGALAIGGSLAACTSAGVGTEAFPLRAIELVNPFPAGGSHDAHARAIASVGKAAFGQPVQVSIRSGGGGTVGAGYVAKQAKPDGYTVMLGDPGSVIIQPITQKSSYSAADLVPIAQIDESPIIIVALPDAPWNTLQELVAAAEAKPGTITYGAGPRFGNDQFAVELLSKEAAVDFKHVPIDGGGNVYRATLAGDVDFGVVFPASAAKDLAEGRLKALGVSSSARLPLLDTPTFTEQGVNAEWLMFRTIFAPAKTDPARQKELADGFVKIGQDKTFADLLTALGETPSVITGDELIAKLAKDTERITAMVKA